MKSSFMFKLIFYLSVFCSVLFPVYATQWERVIDKLGIQVDIADFPNSGVKQFRGVVVLTSSLDSLIAIFSDQSNCTRWLYQCEQGEEIEQISFGERFIYHANGVHFIADTRDYILHTKMHRDVDSGVITIELESSPNYCNSRTDEICSKINQNKFIRVTRLTGRYILTPIGDNGVRLQWTQHIEPKGVLPDFLVNGLVKKIPFESLKQIRLLVKEPPYISAFLSFDQNSQISGVSAD